VDESSLPGGEHSREHTDFQLPINDDFNLRATVRLLQRRPANRIDRWEDDRYLRAFPTSDGVRLVAVENLGAIDAPDVHVDVLGGPIADETARMLLATVRWTLGLDAPPAPINWLAEVEPQLATVAMAMRGFRSPCFPSLFETCGSVLPFQQLSMDAGVAILGRLVERFGPALTLDDRTWFAFPPPEAIVETSVDTLRETGLSRAKAASLRTLARLAIAGDLDAARFQALSTEEALRELRALPGIGPWSAGLILLRGLRRMDVFPSGDVGAARNLTALLGLSRPLTPTEANAFADRFGDRRGYLYFLGLGSRLLAEDPGRLADGDSQAGC